MVNNHGPWFKGFNNNRIYLISPLSRVVPFPNGHSNGFYMGVILTTYPSPGMILQVEQLLKTSSESWWFQSDLADFLAFSAASFILKWLSTWRLVFGHFKGWHKTWRKPQFPWKVSVLRLRIVPSRHHTLTTPSSKHAANDLDICRFTLK